MTEEGVNETNVVEGAAGSNIDGVFETVVDLEGHFHAQGLLAGSLGEAVEQGYEDGRELGWISGAELAKEWGYYRGFVKVLKSLLGEEGGLREVVGDKEEGVLERVEKVVREFDEACGEVVVEKIGNDEGVDFEKRSEELRRLFRKVTAMLGLRNVRYEAKKVSKTADMSF